MTGSNLSRRGASFMLSALLLAGCSQIPEYARPAPPVPAQWPLSSQGAGKRIATQTDWRAFFPDPRLQVLIETALEHNRDLRIAVARVTEARAQYGISNAEKLPLINATGTLAAAGSPASITGTQNISARRYDANIGVISYELDFWGRVSGQAESALASFLSTEEARRAARISLISDVANAYFATLEMEELAALARATVATREKALALMDKGRIHGNSSTYEYLQAEGILASARAGLAALDRQRASANNLLNFLVGNMPASLPEGQSLTNQGVEADLAADIPSEVLLARPDIMAAEQRLISANANIGAARAAFLPRILLTASLGLASKALGGLFSSLAGGAWNYQPAISLPLFDGGRTAANVDIAEARKVMAIADYEKTIQVAFREVADLLAARGALLDQRQAIEQNLRAQEERLKIANLRYAGGMISYLEVLDAQRDFYTAQQGAVQVRREQLVVASQLYKAMGGGNN